MTSLTRDIRVHKALRSEICDVTSVKATNSPPIAYKSGVSYFCEAPFFVNKNVLIPRFDTEVLVEMVLLHTSVERCSVLDLCTGSGCIAVILAKHDHKVTATDISRRALRVARKNARLNGVNIEFVKSDMFNKLHGKWFDVIVCNPPYIKNDEIGKHDETILHEPRIALDGGEDGLDFYRRIAKDAGNYLKSGGSLYLEICHMLGAAVKELLQKNGFHDIQITKDRAGLERVIRCVKS